MSDEQDIVFYLKSNLQLSNKHKFLQTVKQQLTNTQSQQQKSEQKMTSQQQLSTLLQQYEHYYQKFMHRDSLMTNNKSNWLIQEALNSVHPGLKMKKDCKYTLAIMTKIFVQEIIQESLQVLEEYKLANQRERQEQQKEKVGDGYNNGNNFLQKKSKKIKRPQQIDIDVIDEAIRRRMLKKQPI